MSEWTNETAEWYAQKYGEYPTNHLALDAIEIPPQPCIVDIGCGTGSALRHAAGLAPGARLIGIDPVDRMLEIARERASEDSHGHRIEFRKGGADSIPVEDASADLVLAFDSIDHWPDRAGGLAEVKRILKTSGRLVIVKDEGAPMQNNLLDTELPRAGFKAISNQRIAKGDVAFNLRVCERTA